MAHITKTQSLDQLSTYKKLHIMTEFVLAQDLEENFVLFLKKLKFHPDFIGMSNEITQLINEYDIPDEEIYAEIKKHFII